MQLKIIVVSPKYQMNVGYIARVAKNFGMKKLFFVSPRARLSGKKAVMFSKHAADLLKTATVYDSFDRTANSCDILVGTTGIWRNDEISEKEYTLGNAISKIKKEYSKDSVVGLVIGRDDKGLNREEIEKCDMIAHIPLNKEYPVLNISHALAILLYAFAGEGFKGYETRKAEEVRNEEFEVLMNAFKRSISGKKSIRDKKSVANVFSRMVRKAQLNPSELHSMITALK